jgi:hydrogenase maturation factor
MGDYVIIHAGFAIEKFNIEEAEKQLELFRELAETVAENKII